MSMSVSITISQLLKVLIAEPVNVSKLAQLGSGIQTDTRILQPGEVFLALLGEKFDGHDFVPTAIAQGAIVAIVDHAYENPGFPVLRVKDTLKAYQQIAQWWRESFDIPLICITGSVGKTTTKELISAVLATKGKVHKTYGNFNN